MALNYAGQHRSDRGRDGVSMVKSLRVAEQELRTEREFEDVLRDSRGVVVVRRPREAGVLELTQAEIAEVGSERVHAFAASHNLTLRVTG